MKRFPKSSRSSASNHTRYEPPSGTGPGIYRELAPGHVTIVTIPRLDVQNLRDPLKPCTSLGLLDQIRAFLKARAGCFVQLHVMNPQFEAVRVRFKLRLRNGFDESYSLKQTAEAITRFLSPWAFAAGGTPSFGGKVYKSVLINFVEDLGWVDYVTDFRMFRDIENMPPGSVDFDEVEGSRAVSILVSAPQSKHDITLIEADEQAVTGESCSCQA